LFHHISQALIDGYHAEYLKTQRFTSAADAPVESPSGRLWLEYFMSQHYDRIGDSAKVGNRCVEFQRA
jgi:hypothetical protein